MINQGSPVVSVPVFNLQSYLTETLDSILRQSFTDFEVLVIDDGSTDNTVNIIKRYQQIDSRIIFLKNTHKKGASGTRNTGIFAAKGEWIAFLDGDDLWTSDALESRLSCLSVFPDALFISADYACFNKDIKHAEISRANSNHDWSLAFSDALSSKKTIVLNRPILAFLHSILVWTGTVLVKKELVQELGGFNENFTSAEDDHLWLRIAEEVDQLIFIPEVITFYRQRPGSLVNSGKALHHDAPKAYLDLLNNSKFVQYKSELHSNIQDFYHQNCFFYRKNKNYWQAFKCSLHSIYWAPYSIIAWKNFLACCLLR